MNRRCFAQLALATAVSQTFGRPATAQPAASSKQVRFSFMLWALAKQASFDRCVEMVAEAGYNGVELTGEFQKWSPQETQRIMTRMRGLGLVVDAMSGVKAGFAVPEESTSFLQQLQVQIDDARKLECPQIILLSGRRVAELELAKQRQVAIDTLKEAADMAAKHHVQIVIEPIDPLENPTIFLQTVSDGFEITRAVGRDNVKVLYDFYHEQRAFGNLIEKLQKNIDMVGLVHIADVPGRHEPGTGEVAYAQIYKALAAAHYDKFIAMEYYPTTEPVASLTRARKEAEQALRSA
ncbi:TIM barrel protein [Acidipila sp. EB88]|uniref:TIM barrel protein n=1 Tax=Acidipila sp. EB88 TaxID=2305226 RepID=UPI000F5E17D7|nr:TIM barrel protein [Acidipila sp. EB88]RRA49129.1 hydroxypyruvate isomerase [Acidipila sp. EB88]